MIKDTIVALSGHSNQAINIIRISGDQAKQIANQVLKYDITKQLSHTIKYNFVVEENQIVDEVMVSYFQAPKSYTGDEMVEINVHGSYMLGNKILSLLIGKGARAALPGEFTSIAYLNKRIDLTQAEAINDLVNAQTSYQASEAINKVVGKVKELITPMLSDMLEVMANIEVNIDYPEYDDVEVITDEILKPRVKRWIDKLNNIIKVSENNLLIKQGITTAIIGEPNVGKSSLLNSLISEDKALVSNIAGTTRDYVEGEVVIDNIHLKLIDTAGLRDSEDLLENMGMKKTELVVSKAELVILVLTNEDSDTQEYLKDLIKDKKHIIVYNKSDLYGHVEGLNISALNNDIDPLINRIKEMYYNQEINNDITLGNTRQIGLAKKALNSLTSAYSALESYQEVDLIAIDINSAYQHLSDILGQYHRADLLDSIFSNFCLGK